MTNAFGGVFRVAVTDPGTDATSTADDVVHRFYGDRDGDGVASEVTVGTYASGTTAFGSIRYANFTDYLSGDGLMLHTGRDYVLDVELVTGGGGIAQFAILDALVVAPINEAAFDSLEDTFNNQALQHGAETVHGFELQKTDMKAIAASSLAAQGFVPGSTTPFTVGESSFLIPGPQSRPAASSPFDRAIPAADNTVANGQTINMPPNTKGRYLDLLVTSTCMPLEEAPSRAFTLSVTRLDEAGEPRAVPSDYLPTVPLWLDQNPTGIQHAVEVTPVGAASNLPKAHLYVVRFDLSEDGKIYADEPIDTVTLPNLGTVAGTPCGQVGSQALHIFAMNVSN